MKVTAASIPGVLIIDVDVYRDARGSFMETFQDDRYAAAGIKEIFRQDNRSQSRRGVVRGLHYQIGRPQGHLVTVLVGEIFDVGLDLRQASPTFGRVTVNRIDAQSFRQIYLPPGIAHGFCALSDVVELHYKCTDHYVAGDEGGVLWNDPDLGINWPVADPQVAGKDLTYPRLKHVAPDRLPRARFG